MYQLWLMMWLLFPAIIIGVLGWLLFSPLVLEVDTRIPRADIRWKTIGGARVWYEEEWWWSIQIFFYHKTMRFSEMKKKPVKSGRLKKERKRKKTKPGRMLWKVVNVTKTFGVIEWKLAIDTGDYVRNAQLYPLNFVPGAFKHLEINFRDENYFVLKIVNRPWKILYAFLR